MRYHMNNLFISLATDKGISTFHSPEEIEALNLLLIKRGCYVIGDETHLFDPVCLFIKYTEPGFANTVSFSEWLSFSANIALLFPQKQIRVLPATKALAETLTLYQCEGLRSTFRVPYIVNAEGFADVNLTELESLL